ncbi:MAG: Type 1 glutamine amidotransferase-like domain-containing protein [Candidatus Dormibacteria bacterium]
MTDLSNLGPLAMVGSGEFTPAMEQVDQGLLAGRPQRAVFLPTAAALEGEERLAYWVELGSSHFARLAVEAIPLMVRTRADANRGDLAAQVAGAGLVYLSGGNPGFLADTLRGSAVGEAIRAAWHAGSAVAGCSAGAMALCASVASVRDPDRPQLRGLGLVSGAIVIPHFDQMDLWMPGTTDRALALVPAGDVLVGIDEDTALVGGPREWRVAGRQSVHLLRHGGGHELFAAGDELRW